MEKVPITMNWLERVGLQFIQTLTNSEQETSQMVRGLLHTVSEKFRPHHDETILSFK